MVETRGSAMKNAPFIVIEGLDGSGKTTVLAFLKQQFPEACFTREPGGTPFAEGMRTLLTGELGKGADGVTQFLGMWCARRDHVERVIRPSLERNKPVICDRFDASTWAYNVCAQDQPHLKAYWSDIRSLCLGDCIPTLYVFLDVSVETALARRTAHGVTSHFDERDHTFREKVRRGYGDFFTNRPHVIIDAEQPSSAVCEKVLYEIAPLFEQ